MPTTAVKPIKLTDVPVATGVDLSNLKGDNALEILAIFQPRSQADASVLKALLAKAREGKLSGSKGHLTAAEASHRFPDPAVHWVGALELPEGRIAFRGVVDQAQTDLVRWIKARQVSFEPWAEGPAVALDAMSSHRSTRGTPALVGGADDDSNGDTSSTDDTGTDDTAGCSTNGEVDGLRLVRRSTTPAYEIGSYTTPIGYGDGTVTTPQQNSNEVMSGLATRRRSI